MDQILSLLMGSAGAGLPSADGWMMPPVDPSAAMAVSGVPPAPGIPQIPPLPPAATTLGQALEPYPEIARQYPGAPPPTAMAEPAPVAGGGGVPMPRPRPEGAPQADPAAASPQGSDALLKALRGVQAPAAPVAQKVSTPSLPPLRPIQGGGYLDMLLSLGLGQQQAQQGLKLPSTLGQALGGR
jgi:hypothetical protein